MDVSLYEFSCQKALHQGLQYARSLGHHLLEVEHVALAMLRAEAAVTTADAVRLQHHLESYLGRLPRAFGSFKIEFGRRLDAALTQAETRAKATLVNDGVLWDCLCKQSTSIQTFLARSLEEAKAQAQRAEDFQPMPGRSPAGKEPVPGPSATTHTTPDRHSSAPHQDKLEKELREFTIDLSASAERGELDPVIGRDAEVRRVLEILGRKKKNNPLLIGEPGVGKSAVAEAIAQRIADGTVPESMRGKRVLVLDLGAMLAGAKYRGEFEARMKNLLKALAGIKRQTIIFIDEIHMIVGAGNHEGGADAANLLKPALARGEIQCLGATTLDEYRKHIEKDAALERRFQPIMVEEPSRPVALTILRGLKSRYEIHHGVRIDDEALTAAVDLSVRYLTHRKLPDKAIDLIDEAASRLRLQIDSVPALLDQCRAEISQIEIERKAIGDHGVAPRMAMAKLEARLEKAREEHDRTEAIWRRHQDLLSQLKQAEKERQEGLSLFSAARSNGEFDFAAKLQFGELPRLEREAERLQAELDTIQHQHAFLRQVVGAREIADIVATWTRVPVGALLEDDRRRLLNLESRLALRVFGQRIALRKIARTLKRARVGIHDPRRPVGVFLFLGPTGVGKTETAKALAGELFADESHLVRVDMSEFMEAHSTARLVGAPPGYVGFGEGGELTEAVRQRPYSVVLLDEIEKAHPRVLDILLQTFDDGRLTDGRGRLVDFRNTLIIMTSNLAIDGVANPESAREETIRDALAGQLRPEFVNRIDELVVFRRLGRAQLSLVLERLLADLNNRLIERQFRISIGPRLRERIMANGIKGDFGGRAVRRDFATMVIDAVSERVLAQPDLAIGAWQLEINDRAEWCWTTEVRTGYYLPPAA